MSAIELGPLSDRLDEDELKTLEKLLEQAGAKYAPKDEGTTHMIAKRLNEDAMTEFLDRLEAHEVAAEIYVPVEFEGRVVVGDFRVASAQALSDALEELKDELDVEEEEFEEDVEEEEGEEEEEEEEEGAVIEAQLRNLWQLVSDGCSEALEKNMPLHLRV